MRKDRVQSVFMLPFHQYLVPQHGTNFKFKFHALVSCCRICGVLSGSGMQVIFSSAITPVSSVDIMPETSPMVSMLQNGIGAKIKNAICREM